MTSYMAIFSNFKYCMQWEAGIPELWETIKLERILDFGTQFRRARLV